MWSIKMWNYCFFKNTIRGLVNVNNLCHYKWRTENCQTHCQTIKTSIVSYTTSSVPLIKFNHHPFKTVISSTIWLKKERLSETDNSLLCYNAEFPITLAVTICKHKSSSISLLRQHMKILNDRQSNKLPLLTPSSTHKGLLTTVVCHFKTTMLLQAWHFHFSNIWNSSTR